MNKEIKIKIVLSVILRKNNIVNNDFIMFMFHFTENYTVIKFKECVYYNNDVI